MNQEDIRRTLESSCTSTTSSKSQTSFSPPTKESIVKRRKGPTAREIVQTLTSFVIIEKEENDGKSKEFVVVKCPNGQYCKNGNGEIHYPNKSGYKNPSSHLWSCLAKVCIFCIESFLVSHEMITNTLIVV